MAVTNVLFPHQSLADHSSCGRNRNPGDRCGEESCLLSRIADQRVRDENAVSPGPSTGAYHGQALKQWPSDENWYSQCRNLENYLAESNH